MSSMHRPVLKLAIVMTLLGALRLSTASAAAQSLSDLFQQMKSEVNARSWDAALRTMATLQTEAAKPANEATREKLEAPIAFYRGVCEANLGQSDEAVANFTTFLKMQPNATIDSTVHSQQAVAAFDQARKAVADRHPSLTDAYAAFAPLADATVADLADKFWADGPVRWILTDHEKREWAGLTDPNIRIAFVERFWAERAALPGAGSRSYRQEFERRVAFADAYLAHDGAERGSLTDRGMVFILLGPPRTASRKALRGGEDPSDPSGMSRVETQEAKLALKGAPKKGSPSSTGTGAAASLWARYQGPEHRALSTDEEFLEVWQYELEQLPRGIPYPKVDVHYVTRRGAGKNVLQPSTASSHAITAAKAQAAPRGR
jgi:GWxTD domain-containing protein